MKSKIKGIGAAGLAVLLFSAANSMAQISVVGTQTGNFGPVNSGAFSISYQVQNPNDVVVFGTYIDGGSGALSSLSFGTGVGNQAANNLFSVDRTSLAYFLNPSTSPSLSFSGTTAAATGVSAGYFLWELAGVDLAAPVQSASLNNNTIQITTTAANSFITDLLGVNDFGISAIAPTAGATQTEVGTGTFVVPGGGWVVVGQERPPRPEPTNWAGT
jgi:hypothetical protein